MTDNFNGYSFKIASPSVNAPGGNLERLLLVVAPDLHEAHRIAREMIPGAVLLEEGASVLARARALGIRDNDAAIEQG